jgi:hypothetical protein
VAPPQPDAEFELPDFNFDDSDDSQFDEWNEAFEADAYAKAAQEAAQAQWGEEQPFHDDLELAAILASFNTQCFRRLEEEVLEYVNDAHFEHAVEISRQQAATEEAGCLLMAAERQRMLELNAQHQAEAAAREQARLTQNEEFRQWQDVLRGQRRRKLRRCRRPGCATRCAKQRRRGGHGARLATTKGKNDDKAGRHAPSDGE